MIINNYVVEIKGALYDWQIEKYETMVKTNGLKVIVITSKRYFEKARRITDMIVSFDNFEQELPRLLNHVTPSTK